MRYLAYRPAWCKRLYYSRMAWAVALLIGSWAAMGYTWYLDHTTHLRRMRWLWMGLLVASGYILLGWLEVCLWPWVF